MRLIPSAGGKVNRRFVVEALLDFAEVTPKDVVYDLGSGDVSRENWEQDKEKCSMKWRARRDSNAGPPA